MKRLISLAIALILILAVAAPAFAETYAYVKTPTKDGTVYVRKVAGAGQPIMGVANNGDALIILKKGNTWHRVRVIRTGVEGYMYGAYIHFISSGSSSSSSSSSSSGGQEASGYYNPSYYTTDPSVTDTDTVINKYVTIQSSDGYANLRWGPSTSWGIICKEYNGDKLWALDQNGSWYRVVDNAGRVGYVSSKLTKLGSTVSNSSGKTGIIRSSDGFASVRSGPGTSYAQLYTLSVGQSITAYTSSGDWLRVSLPDIWSDAFVYRTLIRFYSKARTTGNVNMRSGPSTSYSKLTVLSNGTNVRLLATDGSFCRVDTGYSSGYVSKKYLSY